MEKLLVDLLLGLGIGLSLGMLGGGGSILTVPILVYIIGQSPQAAIATSLAIVGANSLFGSIAHIRHGTVNWKVAGLFGGSGMVVSYLAAGLSRSFKPATLMVLFSLIMIIIGSLMFFRQEKTNPIGQTHQAWWVVMLAGALVGLLTGLLGVGGGFLIVPALVMIIGLPMQQAVGSSLVIITANSVAGLLGHLNTGIMDFKIVLLFLISGIIGAVIGARLANYLPCDRLRKIFAAFIILLGIFLLINNFPHL